MTDSARPALAIQTAIEDAAELVRKAKRAVVLTGAGISTPSGIPDFRSEGTGLWSRDEPLEVASLTTFRTTPERFFEWFRPLAGQIFYASANAAHLALAQMENAGRINAIVTQNIDGLHQKAGSTYVRQEVCRRSEIKIIGNHNVENVMAAVTYALLSGCSLDAIRRVLMTFPGLEHALEIVRDRRGVRFVNDSKGTNVDATLKALESIDQPIWLIAGGRDKGGDFSRLAPAIRQRVKGLVLIGEATPLIANAVAGFPSIVRAASFKDAVQAAADGASTGEVVLLSPACASFDMFADYQDRGRQFKALVQSLPA